MVPVPTVVVVDDDAAVRHALSFSLELEGYAIRTYADAEAALAAEVPMRGCYVVDHRLPGLDGASLIEMLRALAIPLPAVLITSHPDQALRRRASALQTVIVEKPLLSDGLNTAIRQALAVDS